MSVKFVLDRSKPSMSNGPIRGQIIIDGDDADFYVLTSQAYQGDPMPIHPSGEVSPSCHPSPAPAPEPAPVVEEPKPALAEEKPAPPKWTVDCE